MALLTASFFCYFFLLLTVMLLSSTCAADTDELSHSSYAEDPYYYHNYQHYYPRYYQRPAGRSQRRSLWYQARAIMPRIATGAKEAISFLAFPALVLLAVSAVLPDVRYYRAKREADGR